MTIRTKITILSFATIGFLFSILEPSERLFISLIPAAISSYYWVFENKNANSLKQKLVQSVSFGVVTAYLLILTVLSFGTIIVVDSLGLYSVVVRENIFFFGGKSYPYSFFAIFLLSFYVILSIFDFVNDILSAKIAFKECDKSFYEKIQ